MSAKLGNEHHKFKHGKYATPEYRAVTAGRREYMNEYMRSYRLQKRLSRPKQGVAK